MGNWCDSVCLYAFLFFNLRHGTGPENDWTVPTNPQSMIALCLVTAGIALWFLRDSGAVLAGSLFLAVLAFFGYWAFLTRAIRINMGVDVIPRTDSLGNFWIGATWLDVAVCVATFSFLLLNCVLVVKRRRLKGSPQAARLHPSHT